MTRHWTTVRACAALVVGYGVLVGMLLLTGCAPTVHVTVGDLSAGRDLGASVTLDRETVISPLVGRGQ